MYRTLNKYGKKEAVDRQIGIMRTRNTILDTRKINNLLMAPKIPYPHRLWGYQVRNLGRNELVLGWYCTGLVCHSAKCD